MRNYRDLLVWEKRMLYLWRFTDIRVPFPGKKNTGSLVKFDARLLLWPQIWRKVVVGDPKERWHGSYRLLWVQGPSFLIILLLAKDLEFLTAADYDALSTELSSIMRMLSALSQKVRSAVAV
jgi:hypothetical protein